MSRPQPESHPPKRHFHNEERPPVDANRYSVAECPICQGGLCSVRAYFEDDTKRTAEKPAYGLVICDECEAIWFQPDVRGVHIYADSESPQCPVSGKPLYDGQSSRWATAIDVQALGWADKVDPSLTHDPNTETHDPSTNV